MVVMREADGGGGLTDGGGRLDHLDYRSLRLLSLLLETRSVTRTAELLSISQPAASRAVAQLRHALGDELLVRTPKGWVPTARAETLQPKVADAIASFRAVFEPAEFDPAASTAGFRIASTDYGAIIVLTDLVADLAATGPRMQLTVLPWTSNTYARLESGELDMALYFDGELPAGFETMRLFDETYACVVRACHPALAAIAAGEDAAAAVARFRRLEMLFPLGHDVATDVTMDEVVGVEARAAVRTPYFASAPLMLARTDMVLCAPRRIAEHMARSAGLEVLELGRDEGFGYQLIWHERTSRDAASRWLRQRIAALSAG